MKNRANMKLVMSGCLAIVIVFCFSTAVSNLETGRRTEGKEQLEEALRRTAVSCYAAEGVYPPSLEYMEEHYGIRYDAEQYMVDYQVIASNLMPDITVLELEYERSRTK